jgi:putative flippase GtrA
MSHGARIFFGLGMTSGITAAAEYAVYVLLVAQGGVYYVAASLIAGGFGILFNFALNKLIVFRANGGSARGQLARHRGVTCAGIAGGAALLYLIVDVLGVPYWIGWALQNLFVFVVWTVPANRRFVFPVATPRPASTPRPGPQSAAPMGTHDPNAQLSALHTSKDAVVRHCERVAETYATRAEGPFRWVRAREARALLAAIDARPGELVLDAGCGAGSIARLLAAHGVDVWGVDRSPRMLARARPFLDVAMCADIEALDLRVTRWARDLGLSRLHGERPFLHCWVAAFALERDSTSPRTRERAP